MLEKISLHYVRAQRRLILLDYDGTLVKLQPTPEKAAISSDALSLLQQLTADEKNTVVILSGRDRNLLEAWLVAVPLHLAAEYGALTKAPHAQWQHHTKPADGWKPKVREILRHYLAAAPRSFIEEKLYSLVWHYRLAHPAIAQRALTKFDPQLRAIVKKLDLEILDGHMVVEVRMPGQDKGTTAAHWLESGDWDFILAAGDDIADEQMFAALPDHAYTIKIGPGDTVARDRLKNPNELLTILKRLGGDERT